MHITALQKPVAVDLFSGCGGLTLGLKQAGFNVLASVEIEPIFVETYKMNHPEVDVWTRDIRIIKPAEFMQKLDLKPGELDLLAGCPPCQGFSTIGTQREDDERNDLVFEFLRFVKFLRPKTIMMENVPGLMKDVRMEILKQDLVNMGYYLGDTPAILNAADFGVPQRRRRMILLASQKGQINLALKQIKKKTVRDAIGKLPKAGMSGDYLHDYPEERTEEVMRVIRLIPKDGGSRRSLGSNMQLPCHLRYKGGFRDVYGRMKWDDVSPTITGGCASPSKGRFLHPTEDRCITLREAALLQSFPLRYQFSLTGGKGAIAKTIGNALPPALIRAHAEHIIDHLN